MKQRILFDGELTDGPLDKELSLLIEKSKELGEDVFLRWNGATIRVNGDCSVDALMGVYETQIRVADAGTALLDSHDKHLYMLRNKMGVFYVVAHSFDEAATALEKRLDQADYGYRSNRNVLGIDLVATQRFFNGRQLFSEDDKNLIIF